MSFLGNLANGTDEQLSKLTPQQLNELYANIISQSVSMNGNQGLTAGGTFTEPGVRVTPPEVAMIRGVTNAAAKKRAPKATKETKTVGPGGIELVGDSLVKGSPKKSSSKKESSDKSSSGKGDSGGTPAKKSSGGFSIGGLLGDVRHGAAHIADDTRHGAAKVADYAKKALPSSPREAAEDIGEDVATAGATELTNTIGNILQQKGGNPSKDSSSTTQPPATTSTTTPSQQQLENQIAQSEQFAQLGNALAGDLENAQKPVEQAMSGALTNPAEAQVQNIANAASGTSAGAPAADWLKSMTAQANANDAPMMQAMQAYEKQFNTGQNSVDQALVNLGQANQLGIEAAPASGLANAAPQHLLSNLNYYGEYPSQQYGQSLPPWLQYYIGQAGGPSGSPGTVSINAPSVTPATGGSTGVPATAPSTASALTGGGTPIGTGTTAPDTGSAPS